MVFHNLPRNRQPHTSPFVILTRVKTLKNLEDSVQILFVKTDAIIAYGQFNHRLSDTRIEFIRLFEKPGFHLHDRLLVFLVKFQPVANQILQELPHVQRFSVDDREFANLHFAADLFDSGFKVGQDFVGDFRQVDLSERLRFGRDAREGKKIVD
jgi:hypothetical protein